MKDKSSEESLPAQFDEFAVSYDQALAQGLSATGEGKDFFARGRLECLADTLMAADQPRSILDYGCGTGSATVLLQQRFPEATVVGVDVSARSIEQARAKYSKPGIQFDVIGAKTAAGNFDLAFCNGVFHHIPVDRRQAALQYVLKCLKPGGIFALWENNPYNPGTRYVMSRIPFDRDAIVISPRTARNMLSEAGFEILRTDHKFFFPAILSALRPAERWLCKVPFGGQYQVLAKRPAVV